MPTPRARLRVDEPPTAIRCQSPADKVDEMPAPNELINLVERFRSNIADYLKPSFKETRVRVDFIDPLLGILGWDVHNSAGRPEAYRDVIHEDVVAIAGVSKAPDYGFYIGGERKFFLEAKKPSVNVRGSLTAAVQLRRYAWSAKLPLGILTDFEELAVYDCLSEPQANDSVENGLITFYRFDEYVEKWDEIASRFSRQSVMNGSLEAYLADSAKRRGTRTVDEAFLREIHQWRHWLARDLAERNSLSERELNYAVQLIIDRIVFLRIAEDRGTEEHGSLLYASESAEPYERLCELFMHADDRYNSGLFYLKAERSRDEVADILTPTLSVDPDLIRRIVTNLYLPKCSYEFSVLPVEVLGQIYEQFLGSVISLRGDSTALVEEKPEVRKAGGVYYTPRHVVDYIVESTLSKALSGKRPGKRGAASKLKVLDPACGSGSFLIRAYQYLLDWHRDAYVADGVDRHPKELFQGAGGAWHLTIEERKRILLNNIYGVDVDPQAVEVTKLSLLLKVLEGEVSTGLARQLALINIRALPDLDKNIRCGNSLVGTDFYDQTQIDLFENNETLQRLNPFDWHSQFPDVFARPSLGFDVIIGNPPYIDSEWMTSHRPDERRYCAARYVTASGNWDIFCVFIEKALSVCVPDGYVSMIVPNKLASAGYASGARRLLAKDNRVIKLRDYSRVRVFPVSVYPMVFVAQKGKRGPRDTSSVTFETMTEVVSGLPVVSSMREVPYQQALGDSGPTWRIFSGGETSIVSKIAKCPALGSVASVSGAATVAEAYKFAELISEYSEAFNLDGCLKMINSGTIDRYLSLWGFKQMRYLGSSYLRLVVTREHSQQLPARRRLQAQSPKIIVAGMTKELECVGDFIGDTLAGKSTTVLVTSNLNLKYLLAVLNSKLINHWYVETYGGDTMQGGYLRIGPPQLRTIPIRPIDHRVARDRAAEKEIVELVDGRIAIQLKLLDARIQSDRAALLQQAASIDRRINGLVYNLYELDPSDIEVVEGQRK